MKTIHSTQFLNRSIVLAILATSLVACGGGGGSSTTTTQNPVTPPQSNAPLSTIGAGTTANNSSTSATDANSNANNNNSVPSDTPELAVLNLLNKNRETCGFGRLTHNSSLDKTAQNHANYMATVAMANNQEFASHYEKDEKYTNGSSALQSGTNNPYYSGYDVKERLNPKNLNQKAVATSYSGQGIENIGESYSFSTQPINPVDTVLKSQSMLRTLFAAPYHIRMLVLPQPTEVGISFRQDNWSTKNGYYLTNYLEIVSGIPTNANYIETTRTLTFPCAGITTDYQLTHEAPNPFGYKDASGNIVEYNNPNQISEVRDLNKNPVGQPIYIRVPSNKSIATVDVTIRKGNTSIADVTKLTAVTDPNKILNSNEAFIIPNKPLDANTTYDITYHLTMTDGETATNSFSFTTIAKV